MKACILPILLSVIIVAPVHAETVFEDNFNAAQDAMGLGLWKGTKDRISESDGAWIEVASDKDNLFGEGTENRFLALNDRSDAGQVNLYASLKGVEPVVTVGFDFVEPPESEAGPIVIRIGTAGNEPSELAVNLALRDGGVEQGSRELYTTGVKHRITIVANNSAETVTYGGTSLASQHYDVHIDGERVLSGIPFNTEDVNLPVGVSLNALRLLTYSVVTKDQTFLIDNLKVKNGAPSQ